MAHPTSIHRDFKAIAAEVRSQLQAETAVVALVEDGGDTLFYIAAAGKHCQAIEGKRSTTCTSGLFGVALASGNPELVGQTQGDRRVRQDIAEALGISTALAVSVGPADHPLGALMVLNRSDGGPFGTAAAETLATYARTMVVTGRWPRLPSA